MLLKKLLKSILYMMIVKPIIDKKQIDVFFYKTHQSLF